jgi:hypothetical protein
MQTFVHHLCSIVVRACIFHVFKAVLEHLQLQRGCPREFRLGVLHDFKLIAGSYWKRISPHATLYSSGCVMVVTLSP